MNAPTLWLETMLANIIAGRDEYMNDFDATERKCAVQILRAAIRACPELARMPNIMNTLAFLRDDGPALKS